MRLVVASALLAGVGATLLVADLRWFRRRSLTERLRPYAPGANAPGGGSGGVLSVTSFRDVIGPLAASVGGRIARVAGVDEALATRLERIHADVDPTAFRVRQLGWSALGGTIGAAAAVLFGVPALAGLAFTAGGAALGFLAVEQQLAQRSARWQRRIF